MGIAQSESNLSLHQNRPQSKIVHILTRYHNLFSSRSTKLKHFCQLNSDSRLGLVDLLHGFGESSVQFLLQSTARSALLNI